MNAFPRLAPDTARWKTAPPFAPPGPPPDLKWLPLDALRLDPAYQREIGRAGRINIDRIVRTFSWAKFAPVIVAPIGGGSFAIIDGQHRSTAAAERKFSAVPCMIVTLSQAQQAAAFAAINGATTAITGLALHRAQRAAGDAQALEIDAVCAEAGVRIAPYPKPRILIAENETLALAAVRSLIKARGRGLALAVLSTLAKSRHKSPGHICRASIVGLASALDGHPAWARRAAPLLAAFDAASFAPSLAALDAKTIGGLCQQSFARHMGPGGAAPEAAEAVDARAAAIRDLKARGNSIQVIAARLRCTYAEVTSVLEAAA